MVEAAGIKLWIYTCALPLAQTNLSLPRALRFITPKGVRSLRFDFLMK